MSTDLVLDTDKADIIIIVRKADLQCTLSIQIAGKATSIELTKEQTGTLMNIYWPVEFRIFQEWIANG